MQFQKAASARRFSSDSCKIRQKRCEALDFALVGCCARDSFGFDMLQAFYSMQILASERCRMVAHLSDIIPNLANIMQFADGSFVPVRWQSSKPSCKAQKNVASADQFCKYRAALRFLHQATKILYADLFSVWFWPFHPTEGTIVTLYMFGLCAEGCLHRGMPSRMNAFAQRCFSQRHVFDTQTWCFCKQMPFMHRCFYTRMLLPAGAITHRRAGFSTHRCLYAVMLVHRNASACAVTLRFF